ncbi:MAG: TetR/AcrR family transcriptional regulator [Candidatus Cloacimonetes bacterium]|nr:TetR/AcrR family transcriptional regulator [Candidatus Cloacimonadota bacterium]
MELTKRQRQIVDQATLIIADAGIQALTMNRLAARVGITEPALYRHFKSKRAILETIIQLFDDITTKVTQVDESLRGLSRLSALLRNRYSMFAANPALTRVMLTEAHFQYDKEMAGRVLNVIHSHRAAFAEALAEAQRSGQVQGDIPMTHLFHILIGPVRLLVSRWCLSGFAFDLEQEGKALWESQRKLLHP